MRRMRVYADTSVFGGVADDEYAEASRRFFGRVRRGEVILVVSTQVLAELRGAPEVVRAELESLPEERWESIEVSPEADALADAYLAAGVVGRASRGDAIHVAAASVTGADLSVSWNFRHIVNYSRITRYNAVNVLNGYRALEIRSPAELAYDDET